MIGLEQCIHSNNEAIGLLLSREVEEAFACFRKAITGIRGILAAERGSGTSQQVMHCIGTSFEDIVQDVVSFPSLCPEAASCYVYSNAFLIKPLDTESLPSTVHSATLSLIAACIIFNLALANHVIHQRQRAIELYNMVLHLIGFEDQAGLGNLHDLLIAAAMNNRSQLQFEEGLYHQAQTSLADLDSFMRMPYMTGAPRLQREVMSGLMFNCLMLRPPYSASAA